MIRPKEKSDVWSSLTLIYLIMQFIVRAILVLERPPGIIDTLDILFDGLLWDIGTWAIISLPIIIFLIVLPNKIQKFIFNPPLNQVITFIFCIVFSFISVSEILFWNEFHSRFNFIAVDYLIYTNEVLANLKESFSISLIALGIILTSLIFTCVSMRMLTGGKKFKLPRKSIRFLITIIFPLFFLYSLGPWLENHDEDFHDDQLSRNGIYEFARAFRSNKIDYKAFYKTLPDHKAKAFVEAIREIKKESFTTTLMKPNLVMIVVESLGAKFIGPLDGNYLVTPNLNKLANESIFFEKFYATGTRTVRGLEALTLSVPPTPGYAVIKRPDHKGLYSIGNTFNNNGYSSHFIYGGRGFFDNMNSFFGENGFSLTDQGDFSNEETTFSNAWGVCDEDLFNKALTTIDHVEKSKPFFMLLLTTSNHRPFTYPEGKVDIPSGTGRAGAVKYTDFAIGKFLKDAKAHDWAKNTVFVIVADHSTEGRGQFDLEMNDFHIPLWIYSPTLIKSKKISKIGSQIDLLPTLIKLLGLKDNSPFYGKNLLNDEWTEERAFIGNYQYVGYYKNRILTTLGPNQIVRSFNFDPISRIQNSRDDSPYVDEAISYYQTASQELDLGKYKVGEKD